MYNMTPYYGAQPNGYNGLNSRMRTPQGCYVTLVSNIKEAEAAQPDPLGNPTFFYNMSQNEIYLKQFNNMGAAPLYVFKYSQEYNPAQNDAPVILDYDKRFNELDNKIEDVKKLLTPNVLNAVETQQGVKRNAQ